MVGMCFTLHTEAVDMHEYAMQNNQIANNRLPGTCNHNGTHDLLTLSH